MSDYESHYGKLIKINKRKLNEAEILEFFKNISQEEIPDYYKDIFEYIKDYQDKYPYYFSSENIYTIEDNYMDPYNYVFNYTKIDNKITEYQFRFYNGGTCLEEQIADLIREIEK